MYFSPFYTNQNNYRYSNNIRYIYSGDNYITSDNENIIESITEDTKNISDNEKNIDENNRLNILGFDLNIDDIVLLVTMFFIFQNEENCDYITLIALGLLLLAQE